MKKTIIVILIMGFAFSQSVTIKNSSDEPLLTINDEGTPGASLDIKSDDGSTAIYVKNESDAVRFALNAYSDGRWTLLDRHSNTWNYGITQIGGEVGIGTDTPGAKLDVNGDIKIVDGTQGNGKVLTSNASGLASWQTPSGSGGATYSIGDYVMGGIVFWLDSSGEHGLLCHYEDEVGGTSEPLQWSARTDTSFYTMARGNGPFSGEMNTSIIIASQGYGDGSNYAALSCASQNISDGIKDYGDWYLPSAEELELMWENRAAINATALGEAGFEFNPTGAYWSSTEHDGNENFAKILNFATGSISDSMKIVGRLVRAIRAF